MTLKFTDVVRAEINSLLADNISGDISAADMRQVCTDILDSSAPPDCALISTTSATGQVLSPTPAIVPVPGAISSNPDPSVISANAGNRNIEITPTLNGFLLTVIFEFTIDNIGNGQSVQFTIFKNGLATPWRYDIIGRGNSSPQTVNLVARLIGEAGTIDVRYSAPVATSCDVDSSFLIVQITPTRTAITP